MKKDSQEQTNKRIEIESVENGFVVNINIWKKLPDDCYNGPMPCGPSNYKRYICADADEVKELLAEKL